MTLELDLHGLDLGLLLLVPSGIVYTNQANGVACDHPQAEGVLAPFGTAGLQPYSQPLCDYFTSRECNRGHLEGVDADFIDAFLLTTWAPFVVKVDRTRLTESYEAWVFVVLEGNSPTYSSLTLPGFRFPMGAVLVWENSD